MPGGLLSKLPARKQQPTRSGSLPAFPSPEGGHTQLGLQIVLKDGRKEFVAGESVEGVLKVEVRARDGQLALGELKIVLGGHEALRVQSHSTTSPFEPLTLIFQDDSTPPSAATIEGCAPICGSFYPLLSGRTSFPFSFTLPKTSAASCSVGASAQRHYELRASASVMDEQRGERHSQEKLPFNVVERWEDWQGSEDNWGGIASSRKAARVAKAGDGVLEVEADVGSMADTPARLFWRREAERDIEGKSTIRVKARVRNNTTKPMSGVTMYLIRHVRALPNLKKGEKAPQPAPGEEEILAPALASVPVAHVKFRGKAYEFAPGEKKQVELEMEIPLDECWNTRRGTLFKIDSAVRVEVEGQSLDRPVAVEVPVWIAHQRSLPNSAHEHTARHAQMTHHQHSSLAAPGQMVASPSGYYDPHQQHHMHRTASLVSLNGPPAPYHHPQTLSHSPSTVNYPHGYVPSPSQAELHHAQGGHAPFPSSTSISQLYSAGPPPADPLAYYNQHQQQQQQQQPYQQHQQHQQQPAPYNSNTYLPAPSQVNGGGSTFSSAQSHASSFHYNSAGAQYNAPPPPSVPGSPYYGQDAYSRQPSPAASYVSAAPPPQPAAHDYGPPPPVSPAQYQQQQPVQNYQQQMQQQQQQQQAPPQAAPTQSRGYQPGELVSSFLARGDSEPPRQQQYEQQQQPQQHLQQPSQSQAQRTPSIHSNHSQSSMRRMTPPVSPSTGAARYRSPSPARSIPVPPQHPDALALNEQLARGGNGSVVDLALETIGEDGESQAGTARSVAPAVIASLAAPQEDDEADRQSVHSVRSVKASTRRNSVQDLEDLVRQEEEEKEARERERAREQERIEAEVEREALERRRQQKERAASNSKPKAMDIFAAQPEQLPKLDTAPVPAQPAPSSPLPKRSEGGLSALEARLARPSSPSVPFPSSPNPAPAPMARTLSSASSVNSLRVGGGTSALRARSISRASREREIAERVAKEDPAEAVRRALEAGGGGGPQRVRPASPLKATSRPGSPLKASVVPEPEEEETGETEAEAIMRSYRAKEEQAEVEVQAQSVFRAPPPAQIREQERTAMRWEDEQLEGATSAWEEQLPASVSSHALPDLSHSSPPTTFTSPAPSSPHDAPQAMFAERAVEIEAQQLPIEAPVLVDGRKVVDVAEIRDLRKEAVGRLNQWIKTGASPSKAPSLGAASPWTTSGGEGRRSARIEFGRVAPAPPTHTQRAASPFEERLAQSPSTASFVSRPRTVSPARERSLSPVKPASPGIARSGSIRPQEATAAQLLAAESRAALRSSYSISRLAVPSADENKRAAAGGRMMLGGGGAVAQATGKWAQIIEDEERARGADEEAKRAVMAERERKRASAPATAFSPAERLSLRNLNLADEPRAAQPTAKVDKRMSTPPMASFAQPKVAQPLVNRTAAKRPIFSGEGRAPVGVQVKREVPVGGKGGIAALRAKWEQQRE